MAILTSIYRDRGAALNAARLKRKDKIGKIVLARTTNAVIKQESAGALVAAGLLPGKIPSSSSEDHTIRGRVAEIRGRLAIYYGRLRRGHLRIGEYRKMLTWVQATLRECEDFSASMMRVFEANNRPDTISGDPGEVIGARHRAVVGMKQYCACIGQLDQFRMLIRVRLRDARAVGRQESIDHEQKEQREADRVRKQAPPCSCSQAKLSKEMEAALAFANVAKRLLPGEWRERLKRAIGEEQAEIVARHLPGLPTLVDENTRLKQIVRAMLWDSLPIVTAVLRGGDGLNKPCLSTMELSVDDLLRFADRFQEIQKEHLSSNKGLISLLVGYPTCSVGERAP